MKLPVIIALAFVSLASTVAAQQTVVDGSLTSACAGSTMTLDPAFTQNVCTVTQAITTIAIPAGAGGARPFLLKIVNPSGAAISGWPSTVAPSVPPMAAGTTYLRGIWDPTANSNLGQWIFQQVGNQSFYGPAGLLSGGKCWLNAVPSNAGGNATINYSSAGFTNPPLVFIQPVAPNANASGQVFANPVTGNTPTQASVSVTTPSTIAVGGLAISLAAASYTLNIMACGN